MRSTCTGRDCRRGACPSPAPRCSWSLVTASTTHGARPRQGPTSSTGAPRSSATLTASPTRPVLNTIQVERTVHGPVVGRTTAIDPGTGASIPVAVSVQRSTWGDELGSAPAFLEWNDPDIIHGATDFQRAAGLETGTFNWTYVDSKDVAYYMSGQLPVRNPH